MRIRNKPKKPVRQTIEDRFWVEFGTFVEINEISNNLMDQVRRYLADGNCYYKRAGVTEESYDQFFLEDQGYDSSDFNVIGIRKETDAEFKRRENAYKRALKSYNEWYEKNKDKIEAEIQSRERKAKEKKQAEVKRLEAKLKKLKNG